MVWPIAVVGDFLLATILEAAKDVPREVAKGMLSDLAKGSLEDAIQRLGRTSHPELWQAVVAALVEALRELRKRARTEDERAILGQLEDSAASLFPPNSALFERVLTALLRGRETDLGDSLWQAAQPYAGGESAVLRDRLRSSLAPAVLGAFTKVLKEEPHRRAWIDYQREALQAVSDQLTTASANFSAEQRRGITEIQELVRALVSDPSVWAGVAGAAAEANREVLERELRRVPLYQEYAGSEVAANVEQIVQQHARLLVGRDGTLTQLDAFVAASGRSAPLLITSGPGVGKSALLAHWIIRRRDTGRMTVHHFFSQNHPTTSTFANGLRNLLRQLYIYHALSGQPLPSDEPTLRDAIHGLLSQRSLPGDPLVLVVDGLDEAAGIPGLPLPAQLPDGVFVIGGGRAEQTEPPAWSEYWPADTLRWHLDRLPRSAIQDWLRRAGEGLLVGLADDDSFIAELDDSTQGFALYLTHLLQALAETARQTNSLPELRALVGQAPRGFSTYVDQQWTRLARALPGQHAMQHLIALLAVARGPLGASDIQALTGLTPTDLLGLPWQVARWLSSDRRADTYVLGHPLLAVEFQRSIGSQAQRARDDLIAYCAQWQQHRSPYALRHYAEHLSELSEHDPARWSATGRANLFALARDKVFARTQAEALPDDPYLRIDTLRTAIRAAAEASETHADQLVEFVLAHARARAYLMQLSPLEAVRAAGAGSLERAWQLADLHGTDERVLWYLVLSWELEDAGRGVDARATLSRLVDRHLSVLSDQRGSDMAYLLAHAFQVSEASFASLAPELVRDWDRGLTCAYLAQIGYLPAALRYVNEFFSDDQRRRQAELELMVAVLANEDRLEDAEQVAECIDADGNEPGRGLQALADAWSARALRSTRAREGNSSGAALDRALRTARAIPESTARALALVKLAVAQDRCGDTHAAEETLAEARAAAGEPKSPLRRGKQDEITAGQTLRKIAAVQAELGLFSDATLTASAIQSPYLRAIALAETARSLARRGEEATASDLLGNARGSCASIDDERTRALAEAAIGEAEVLAESIEAGRQTFARAWKRAMALDTWHEQIETSSEIGLAQGRAGQTQDARRSFAELRASVLRVDDQLAPTERHFSTARPLANLAVAQAAVGLRDEAFETLKDIRSERARDAALGYIAVAQARRSQRELALTTCEMIRNATERDATIRAFAALATRANTPSELMRILEEERIETTGVRYAALGPASPPPASEVAYMHERSGDLRKARDTIAESLSSGLPDETQLRCAALLQIARSCAGVGLLAQAEQVLADLRRAPHDSGWWWQNSLEEIALVQAQMGLPDTALSTVSEIRYEFERTSAVAKIARATARAAMAKWDAGDRTDAQLLLAKARSMIYPGQEADDRLEALAAIGLAEARTGNPLGADAMFMEARQLAASRDSTYPPWSVVRLTADQAAAALYDEARDTALGINLPALRANAIAAMVTAMATAASEQRRPHLLASARNLVEQNILDPSQQVRALLKVAGGYASLGLHSDAQAMLSAAQTSLGLITWRTERIDALRRLGLAQAVLGDDAAAFKTVDEAQAGGAADEATVLVAVAVGQSSAGSQLARDTFLRALRGARQIADPVQRAALFREIAVSQAKCGLPSEAVQTARLIEANRDEHLPPVLDSLATPAARQSMLQLAIPSGSDLTVAYRFCGLLASVYPEQGSAIARPLLNGVTES